MGAYAHSPLRELILGGVTRYMADPRRSAGADAALARAEAPH